MSLTDTVSLSTKVAVAMRPTSLRSSMPCSSSAGPLMVADVTSVFCDDYLELVKERAYGATTPEGQASAVTALTRALDVLLRLFAPTIPFATEEVWNWTHEGSVHRAAWPTATGETPTGLLPLVSEALISVRRAKTDAKASQKTEVVSATISGPALLQQGLADLAAVGRIQTVTFVESETVSVSDIVLAEVAE